MQQTILLLVLVGALCGAVVGFCGLGILQHFRSAAMARWAHESGMHFSPQDTFDVPRRCAAFAICSGGHSPQASNVTYGRLRGLPVRAFDFRYEVAHGTRRSTRHYCVVLVEAPCLEPVLMWNRLDADGAPPPARWPDGVRGDWSGRGDAAAARRLGDACSALASSGVSIEARAEGLMLCFPAHRGSRSYAPWLEAAPGLIDSLALGAPPPAPAEAPRRSGADPENRPSDAVANRPPPC